MILITDAGATCRVFFDGTSGGTPGTNSAINTAALPTVGAFFAGIIQTPIMPHDAPGYTMPFMMRWSLRSGSPTGAVLVQGQIDGSYTESDFTGDHFTLNTCTFTYTGGLTLLGGPEAFVNGSPSGLTFGYPISPVPIPASGGFAYANTAIGAGTIVFMTTCFEGALAASTYLVCDAITWDGGAVPSGLAHGLMQIDCYIGSRPAPAFTTTSDDTGLASFDGSASVVSHDYLNGGTLTDSYASIVLYGWDYNDGNTGTGVTPTHLYEAAGTYNPVLTTTTNYGAANSISHSLNITQHLPAMAHNPQQGALHYAHNNGGLVVATSRNQAAWPSLGVSVGGTLQTGRLVAFVHQDILYVVYYRTDIGLLGFTTSTDGGQTFGAGFNTSFSVASANGVIGATFDPSINSLTVIGASNVSTIKRVCFRSNSYGTTGWTVDTQATVTGIPSNIKPGRLFYDGTALLLCAKSGADLNLYQSLDGGFTFSLLSALATGYAYIDAVYDAHTGSLVCLLRDGAGNAQRLVARHNGAGAWQADSIQAATGIPANLGGVALCAFNDTHMQANKLTSTIALRQSSDELFSFASL